MPNTSLLQRLSESAQFIRGKLSGSPKVAVVFGSGLGATWMKRHPRTESISYDQIPHYFKNTVEGHGGRLLFSPHPSMPCLLAEGRFHYYEGYSMEEVVYPIRLFKALGVETLILTNSAGGLNPQYKRGDLVLVSDHINLTGQNPLRGINEPSFGPRFPDISRAYSPDLRKTLQKTSKQLKMNMKNGVYVGISGPSYETPAEIKMFRKMGGDLIGMSTVPEVIAAAHMGLKTAVISCVTNKLLPISKTALSHEQVVKAAQESQDKLYRILEKFLGHTVYEK